MALQFQNFKIAMPSKAWQKQAICLPFECICPPGASPGKSLISARRGPIEAIPAPIALLQLETILTACPRGLIVVSQWLLLSSKSPNPSSARKPANGSGTASTLATPFIAINSLLNGLARRHAGKQRRVVMSKFITGR